MKFENEFNEENFLEFLVSISDNNKNIKLLKSEEL